MKKLLSLVLALATVLSLAACGKGTHQPADEDGELSAEISDISDPTAFDTSATSAEVSSEEPPHPPTGESIRFVNGMQQADAPLKKLAELYEDETGIHVEIETVENDPQSALMDCLQDGTMPDIFTIGSREDFIDWTGLLVNMHDQNWTSHTDAAFSNEEGTLGFPYTMDAIGFAYNADLLAQVDIDPESLTSPAAYEECFARLDAMKEELGLTAVVGYCANPVEMYQSTGNYLFGSYLDAGLSRGDTGYIDLLSDGGKLDRERLTHFAEFIELMTRYSDPDLLISGTYEQQLLHFAAGKYAFVPQGSQLGADMTSVAAETYQAAGSFAVEMAPYAFEEDIDTILTEAPAWWAVYREGKVDKAEAFLQWLTTDPAQQVLVEEGGFISPFDNCAFVADNPFADSVSAFISIGKTSGWHWKGMIEGLAQNYTAQVFADFAAGKLDVAGYVNAMEQACAKAYGG